MEENTAENAGVCFFCMCENYENLREFTLPQENELDDNAQSFVNRDIIDALKPALGNLVCELCIYFFKMLFEVNVRLKTFLTRDITADNFKRKQSFIQLHKLFFTYYRNSVLHFNPNLYKQLNLQNGKSPYTPSSLDLNSSGNNSEDEHYISRISRAYNSTPVLIIAGEQPYILSYEKHFENVQMGKVRKMKHKAIDSDKKLDTEVARFMSKPRGNNWTRRKGERQSKSRMKQYNSYINTPGIENRRHSVVDFRSTSALSHGLTSLSRASALSTKSEPAKRSRKTFGSRQVLSRSAKEKNKFKQAKSNKNTKVLDKKPVDQVIPEKIVCTHCPLALGSTETMNDHKIRDHGIFPRYHCTFCRMKYASRDDFKRHCITHEETEIICSQCHLTFNNEKKIAEHLYEHLTFDILCRFCDRSFVLRNQLVEHVAYDHNLRNRKLISRVQKKNIFIGFNEDDLIKYSSTNKNKMNDSKKFASYCMVQRGRLFNSPPMVFDESDISVKSSDFEESFNCSDVEDNLENVTSLSVNNELIEVAAKENATITNEIETEIITESENNDLIIDLNINEPSEPLINENDADIGEKQDSENINDVKEPISTDNLEIPLDQIIQNVDIEKEIPKRRKRKKKLNEINPLGSEQNLSIESPADLSSKKTEINDNDLNNDMETEQRRKISKSLFIEEEIIVSTETKKPFLISKKASEFLSKISKKSYNIKEPPAEDDLNKSLKENEIKDTTELINSRVDIISPIEPSTSTIHNLNKDDSDINKNQEVMTKIEELNTIVNDKDLDNKVQAKESRKFRKKKNIFNEEIFIPSSNTIKEEINEFVPSLIRSRKKNKTIEHEASTSQTHPDNVVLKESTEQIKEPKMSTKNISSNKNTESTDHKPKPNLVKSAIIDLNIESGNVSDQLGNKRKRKNKKSYNVTKHLKDLDEAPNISLPTTEEKDEVPKEAVVIKAKKIGKKKTNRLEDLASKLDSFSEAIEEKERMLDKLMEKECIINTDNISNSSKLTKQRSRKRARISSEYV